ncbi:MAG: DMT family transporter [Pseudomonadota bacterium]
MDRKERSMGERIRGYKAVAMLVGAMSLAGSSVVVGKMLVATVPVFVAAFSSLLVAFVCMIPLMLGRFDELRLLTAREWMYLFLQGLCGIVLFRVFTLYGLHMTGAVQAGIITGATPAVLALLSLLLLGERISGRMAAGIVLAALGCMVINVFALGGGGENNVFGSLLVGLAVVSEALFTIFRKRICHSVSAITNTAVLIFCSLLLLAVPAALEFRTMSTGLSPEAIAAIVYYGVFATVLAYLLWTGAVGQVSGSTAGAATAAMPASSVILAVVVLGEPPHWQHLAGCLLIISGILVTSGQPPMQTRAIQAADRSNR